MNKPFCQRLLDRAPRFRAAAIGRGQRGAVLVIGLIILLLVSLISVTGANRTLLDEHMASNQYTQTNSFLAAEAGITVAQHIADDNDIRKAVEGGDAKAIESAWEPKISQYESWNTMGGSKNGAAAFRLSKLDGHSTYWDPDTKTLDVASQGRLTSGTSTLAGRTLGAQIIPAHNGGPSPFGGAVIGRDGITLLGSPLIDTFNSNYGAYDKSVNPPNLTGGFFTNSNHSQTSPLSGVSAQSCSANATIYLQGGGSPIYGNILGTGDLKSNGKPTVYGNVHVNGNADFSGSIYGDVTVGGNATLGQVTGNVLAGGDVTIDASSSNGPLSIRAGGTINSSNSAYKSNLSPSQLNIQPVSASDAGCSSFQGSNSNAALAAKFSSVRQNPATVKLADWLAKHPPSNNGKSIVLGTDGETTLLSLDGSVSNALSSNKVKSLTILGHVTLLVDGDFNLSGNATINVGSTATLTLLVTGSTTLGGGTDVQAGSQFVRQGADGQKQPAIAVYTTYSGSSSGNPSDVGVRLRGNNSSHIAVYSPNATVDVRGTGDIYGSVVAKKITLRGNGGIHYDEALKTITIGGKSTNAQIRSWWQVLNN